MRTPTFWACALVLGYLCACQPNGQTPTTTDPTITKTGGTPADLSLEDTISLEEYNEWTKNWKDHGSAWLDTQDLWAFNLPLFDLSAVLAEDADSSRFYLGLRSKNGGYMAKLMVVGVDSNGKDMINYREGLYVYDASSPCPPLCGEE